MRSLGGGHDRIPTDGGPLMAETLEECMARAAACRAAAASEVLDSVRRVHLKAATSWEILGERAQWVAPPRDLPTCAHSSGKDDGVQLSRCLESEGHVFQAKSTAEQVDAGRKLPNTALNSEALVTPCERMSVAPAEGGILEFGPGRDPATCNAEKAQLTGTVVLYAADGHLRKLRQIEADLIRLAIELYDGRMVEVARRLGIGRSTLYRKMSASGMIQPDDAYNPESASERH
jgi:hypothetical protein